MVAGGGMLGPPEIRTVMPADSPRLSVPAVFEGGAVRLLSPAPFADGVELTVAVAGRVGETVNSSAGTDPSRDDAPDAGASRDGALGTEGFPSLEADDPLLKLSGLVIGDPLDELDDLVIDGPPDGSRNVDDYKLGRKKRPPE